ncbi:MAG TPA: hypothetical protein VGC67_02905 [Cellulomonas sp.]
MTGWTEADPGQGCTDAVRTAGSAVRDLLHRLEEVSDGAQAVDEGCGPEQWDGDSADAWRERAAEARTRISALLPHLDAVASGLSTDADAVDAIADDASSYQRTMLQCSGSAAFDLADRTRAQRELAWDRRSADSAVVAALAPLDGRDGSALRTLIGGTGLTGLAGFDRADVTGLLVETAQDPEGMTDAQWALLAEHLRGHQHDPTTMARFFERLGGDGTLDLLAAAGDRLGVDAGYAFATTVRTALSTASADWPAGTAARFAEGLTDRLLDLDPFASPPSAAATRALDDLLGLEHLLGDPEGAPMGVELSRALATWVDDVERSGGDTPWTLRLPATALAASAASYLLQPGALADGRPYDLALADAYADRCTDLGGAVLATLAVHPDAALDWLTDPEHGADQLGYWFEDRDWLGSGEGFTGATALWAGVQQATGGPLDPDAVDLDVWRRVTDTVARIGTALATRDDFRPEALSAGAARHLAQALADLLPLLAEVPFGQHVPPGIDLPGSYEHSLLIRPDQDTWPLVGMDVRLLAELLGTAALAGDGFGAQVLAQAVQDHVDTLQRAVAAGQVSADEALMQIARLYGNLDGARIGSELAEAARAQEKAEQQLGGLQSLLNVGSAFVAIPAAPWAASPPGWRRMGCSTTSRGRRGRRTRRWQTRIAAISTR